MAHFKHGYALLVGVGNCKYSRWSLPVTIKDVTAIKNVLTDPGLCGYGDDDDHLRLLCNNLATKEKIMEGLIWLKSIAEQDPEATIIVYFSGHGWLNPANGNYYLIPHDVNPTKIADSAVVGSDFAKALQAINSQKLLVILDCCHAQGVVAAKGLVEFKLPNGDDLSAPEGFMPQSAKGQFATLVAGKGVAMLASSDYDQISWIKKDQTCSVFTSHLIDALRGAGNSVGDQEVTVMNLVDYLGKTVAATARAEHQAQQDPQMEFKGSNYFPIALLCGGKVLLASGFESLSNAGVTASGDGAIIVNGNVENSVLITGDNNTVSRKMRQVNQNDATGIQIQGQSVTLNFYQSQEVNPSIEIDECRCSVRCWQPRNPEMTKIKQWFKEKTAIIEVTGLGGYGKSALVSQIFKDESLGSFHKRIWINFSQPYSFNQVGNWLLLKLNQKATIDDNIDLINKLIFNLSKEPVLLVFDNFEILVKEERWVDNSYEPFLTKWGGHSSNSHIIITSRHQLLSSNTFSQSLSLQGLELESATKFLKRQGISGNKSDLLDFVNMVYGHPLLMNFIIRLMKNQFGESVNISRYKELDVNLLQITGTHKEEKEISLITIFDSIFNELSLKLKSLLINLSVHRHPFDFELAHSLSFVGNNEGLSEKEFEQLFQYSLLQELSDQEKKHKYSFQPLVKCCLEERISKKQLRNAHRIAASYYEDKCITQKEWRCTKDIFEYLEAFYHYFQLREYEKACNIIFLCDIFLDSRGYNYFLVKYYNNLYSELSVISDTTIDTSEILLKMGNAYRSIRNFEKAIDSYHQSFQESKNNIQIQCLVLNGIALMCHEPDITDSICESIWKILETSCRADQYTPKIYKDFKLMKNDFANKYFKILLDISVAKEIKSKILISLGNAKYLQKEYNSCIEFYEKSLAILDESINQRDKSNLLGNIGNAYFQIWNFDMSIKNHKDRLNLSQDLGDEKGEINSLFTLCILFFLKFKLSRVVDYLYRLIDVVSKTQIPNDSLPLPKWFRLILRIIALSSSLSNIEV
jgi:tetratricopeptide (TPR) repeat protein